MHHAKECPSNAADDWKESLQHPQNAGHYFYNLSSQYYGKEKLSDKIPTVDAVFTEPPSAPNRSCISSAWKRCIEEDQVGKLDVTNSAYYCGRVLKPGGYIIHLADFFMVDEWLLAFRKSCFNVMPYPYVFMYSSETVPKRMVSGFPRNVVQYAVVAKCPGLHLYGFTPSFGSHFTDIDCPTSKETAVVSSVSRPK